MSALTFFPFLMVFYEVTTYLSNDMYLPALPQLAQDLGTTNNFAQLTLTTWFLGAASMQLILGPISDQHGRRPVLLIGGLVFIIATTICAVTTDISLLLVARFLQGCAVCSVVVAGYAAIHELYDQKNAIRVLAIMSSITVLAPAFGPLIGSFILQFASWRLTFWLLAVLATLSIALLYKWMPESNPIEQRQAFSFQTLFANYRAVLMNPAFLLNTLAFCFIFGAMIAWIAAGPFLIIEDFHSTAFRFGIYQALIFSCFILGSHFVKNHLEQIGIPKLIWRGLLISSGAAIFSLMVTRLLPQHISLFILSLMIFNFGAALAFGPLHRIAIEACSEPMGIRVALSSCLVSWSGVLASTAASISYNGTSFALSKILLGCVFIAFILRWKIASFSRGNIV